MIEQFEWLTISFILANLASEAIKYVGVKIFKKIDARFHTPLD